MPAGRNGVAMGIMNLGKSEEGADNEKVQILRETNEIDGSKCAYAQVRKVFEA